MKTFVIFFIFTLSLVFPLSAQTEYLPTKENLEARKQFANDRFGIFIHWGIYSTYAQGEWYLQDGKLNKDEYAKAATCFFPIRFNAHEWVKAIKNAGAKYICFTSRHHDGFSMFKTAASSYNIVDGTPFKRDIVGELSQACHDEGINMHIYYSLLDWYRDDYPIGSTGHDTGRKGDKVDYNSYFNFMKEQIKELLTHYGPIRALWFDGYWDHLGDKTPFDWRMPELYQYIHTINPACLIGNNHHLKPITGEDFQMFERDLPGENTAGMSGQEVSKLPLEMCQTMNGMWGYKVADLNYKSLKELIQLLVKCAGKGSNLLLNIGPRPDGELPDMALNRLKEIGEWMKLNGETIYGTEAGDIPEQSWGISTKKGNKLYLHVLSLKGNILEVSMKAKVTHAIDFATKKELHFSISKKTGTISIQLTKEPTSIDYIIELTKK
ncbi:MAG: alpha-L-fucosidase [Bacteroidaceae bacterium]|jgi:alpha-L-fucosidase|nr:alpha-L-fucosidase [Bacteroidaceae bacterium]